MLRVISVGVHYGVSWPDRRTDEECHQLSCHWQHWGAIVALSYFVPKQNGVIDATDNTDVEWFINCFLNPGVFFSAGAASDCGGSLWQAGEEGGTQGPWRKGSGFEAKHEEGGAGMLLHPGQGLRDTQGWFNPIVQSCLLFFHLTWYQLPSFPEPPGGHFHRLPGGQGGLWQGKGGGWRKGKLLWLTTDQLSVKRWHYRFEQDESLTKSATHSENAIKSI